MNNKQSFIYCWVFFLFFDTWFCTCEQNHTYSGILFSDSKTFPTNATIFPFAEGHSQVVKIFSNATGLNDEFEKQVRFPEERSKYRKRYGWSGGGGGGTYSYAGSFGSGTGHGSYGSKGHKPGNPVN